MGFKTDTSFLRFLSMGAIGVQHTMRVLKERGFEPIELERYCASNKIWMTKVKRLRLPDILCMRTGLRLEARGKSDLKIRMSDAPNNPERTWDAGSRDDDVVAFVALSEASGELRPVDQPVFVTVGELRASIAASKLGPPKSASEGAERDRIWPTVVPKRNGTVKSVTAQKLVVEMHGDGNPSRMQTYTLNGKHTYVTAGDTFIAGASILAGSPEQLAGLDTYLNRKYDPLADLHSENAVDRYAAVKTLPRRDDLRGQAVGPLEALLVKESEERVALEAAGSASSLGSALGQKYIGDVLWGDGRPDMRMEAVLILTELGSPFARKELERVARDKKFEGDEIRQAAVWGLGKAGLKSYSELLQFIDDADENVAMHAVVAFGSDTPETIIRTLVKDLSPRDPRRAAAVSEVLRVIGTETVVRALVEAATDGNDWIIATLGRMPPALVRECLAGSTLLPRVAPLLLLNQDANWLATENRIMDLAFLSKQNV